ncbi:MAG: flagellar biosynthetic protein FliR [Planctomycetota bacterium]|jgi:flagellar biosynthetic protein FliR
MNVNGLLAFVLVLVRVGSIFAFLPMLGRGNAPRLLKVLTVVVISLVLFPVQGQALPVSAWQPIQFFLFAAAEALFGAVMGISALLVFQALRNAGEMVGQQMGMALAAVADPVSGMQGTLVGTFCDVVGVMVFFSIGGHIWMLQAVHDSFSQWPLGAFLSPEFIRRVTTAAALRSFAMAFQLASPLLLLTFLVSLTMAITARLVPEMNILIVGFPLRIGAGLIGLTLSVPFLVRYSSDLSRVMIEFVAGVARGA